MVDVAEWRERRMGVFIATVAALACSQLAGAWQYQTAAIALVLFSIVTSFAAATMTAILWIRVRSMVAMATEMADGSERKHDDASDR